MFAVYVQYLLHMYNSALPYIEAWVTIYQVVRRIGLLESVTFQLLLRMLSSFPAVIKKL